MTLPASLFLDERPLAQAIAPPPEPPGDEPQSLVLAVELGQVAQQLRHRWARLDLNLPERGTWPLESWRPALHEALYGLLGGAAQARPWQRITLNPALAAGGRGSRPTTGRLAGRTTALARPGRVLVRTPAVAAQPGQALTKAVGSSSAGVRNSPIGVPR